MIKARPVAGDAALGAELRHGDRAVRLSGGARDRRRSTRSVRSRSGSRSTSVPEARPRSRSSAGGAGSETSSSPCSCCRSSTVAATSGCASPTPSARSRSLAAEGYVTEEDASALAGAYRFLRPLEHRLQMVRDLQTHELPPTAGRGRSWLARSGSTARTTLQAEYGAADGARAGPARAPVLPSAPRGVRGHERRRSRALDRERDRGAARRSRVRAARPVLRGPRAARRPRNAPRQGASPRLPGDGAGARARRRSRRGARPAGAGRWVPPPPSPPWPTPSRAIPVRPGASPTRSPRARSRRTCSPPRPSGSSRCEEGAEAPDAPSQLAAVVARYASRELGPKETGLAISAVAGRVVREAVSSAGARPPVRRDRSRQARRRGAELRLGPGRDVRLRGRGAPPSSGAGSSSRSA